MKEILSSWLSGLPAAVIVMASAACVLLVCHGCGADKTVGIRSAQIDTADLSRNLFDFDNCLPNGDCYSGIVYDYESAIGSAKIALTYQDRRIKAHSDRLGAMGYLFTPDRSTYTTSETVDGTPLWMVCLLFDGEAAPGEINRALIRYVSIRNYGDNLQTEQWYAGAFPVNFWVISGIVDCIGVDSFGRLEWTQSHEPETRKFLHDVYGSPVLDPPEPEVDPESVDYWQWLKCIGHEATIGCAAGAGACLMAPEEYGSCAERICRESIYSAIIGCSVDQF